MTLILGVQLEFTHAIGPTPGLYVVQTEAVTAPTGAALPHLGDLFGVTRTKGSADVMAISVVEAAPARRALSKVLGSRRGVTAEPGEVRPVSVLTVGYAFASRPFDDHGQAQSTFDRLQQEPEEATGLVVHALAALNRGVDAFREAARDPYVVEVAPEDPRVIRVTLATPDEARQNRWSAGFTITTPRRRFASRAARAAALRPSEAVAQALAGDLGTDPVELHLLRAQLDLEHGRPRSAAAELACALQLAAEEDEYGGHPELAAELAALRPALRRPEATERGLWELLDRVRDEREREPDHTR